ncbi:hypothetical protein [Mycetocola sp. 2940]|uniref:hypothetical protein n=1 Tax=Mycetocola sp. 2940 TaxID=3156452 RepID=UPI003394F4BA
MMASVRRRGIAGLAAALGVLLLVSGVVAAAVDAQLRSDAATAAVTLTPEERRILERAGMVESVVDDAGFIRRVLILQSLSTGVEVPDRAYQIREEEDGNVSMSWRGIEGPLLGSPGGAWQWLPTGVLTFAGLALIIGSLFLAAARWNNRHPLAGN